MHVATILFSWFGCTQMESPGEPFSPVSITDVSKQSDMESVDVNLDEDVSKKEEVDPLFEPTGSILVVSEKKEEETEESSKDDMSTVLNEDVPKEVPEVPKEETTEEKNEEMVESDKAVIAQSASTQVSRSDMFSMGTWPLRVVKTEAELNPPRAILGLPNGKEVVIQPGMQLVDEGLVVMSIGKRGVVLAKITAQGDHAQIESITLTSLND